METGWHVRLYVFIIYVLKIIITVRSHVFMQQFNSLLYTFVLFIPFLLSMYIKQKLQSLVDDHLSVMLLILFFWLLRILNWLKV